METYIILGSFVAQSGASVSQGPAILDGARQMVEAVGGKWLGWYLTFGQYDMVMIVQVPDIKALLKGVMGMVVGGVRTQTLRAMTEDEFRQLATEM